MTEQERAQFYSTTPFAQADTSGISQVFNPAGGNFFNRIGSTNMGEIVGGISGGSTGGTSSRQHAKKLAKISKNHLQTLQNRALEPPKWSLEPSKTLFSKDL